MGTVATAWGRGGGGAPWGVLVGPVWEPTCLGMSVNVLVCEDTFAIHTSKGNTLET